MSINLREFVSNLSKATKEKQINWAKVSPKFLNNAMERIDDDDRVLEAYSATNKNEDVVVIGRAERRVYISEDEYNMADYYFLTQTDTNYKDRVTFYEQDSEFGYFGFPIDLARLYRLIKINYMDTDNKFKNFLQ